MSGRIEQLIADLATGGTIVCHVCNASDVTDDGHRADCPALALQEAFADLSARLERAEEALRAWLRWSRGNSYTVLDDARAALAEMKERAERMEAAHADAQHVLTPTAHRGAHRDAWRLDRARWHRHYGDSALALAELKDMNMLRESYRLDGRADNEEIPESALDEPVGAALSSPETPQR